MTTNFMYITYSKLLPAALKQGSQYIERCAKTDRQSKTGKTLIVYK